MPSHGPDQLSRNFAPPGAILLHRELSHPDLDQLTGRRCPDLCAMSGPGGRARARTETNPFRLPSVVELSSAVYLDLNWSLRTRILAPRTLREHRRRELAASDAVDAFHHRHRDVPHCGYYGAARVRSWLKADIQSPEIEVRFAPESGHSAAHAGLPLLTRSRHSEDEDYGRQAYQ